jgi:hypothetical protein
MDFNKRFSLLDNIPEELQERPQWVLVSSQLDHKGELAKVPVSAHTHKGASVMDKGSWSTFGHVAQQWVMHPDHYIGIGFVLTDDDPYVFLDLDNKPHKPAAPGVAKWFAEAVRKLGCYSETSISGHGAHALLKSHTYKSQAIANGLELYGSRRYFLLTGNVWHPGPIVEDEEFVDSLHELISGSADKPLAGGWADGELNSVFEKRTKAEVLEHLRVLNADIYTLLYEQGDSLTYSQRRGWPSGDDRSRADYALLQALCHVTRSDELALEIFNESGMSHDQRKARGYSEKHDSNAERTLAKIRKKVLEEKEEQNGKLPRMDFSKFGSKPAAAPTGAPPPLPVPAPPPIPVGPASAPPPPPLPRVGMFPSGMVGDLAQYFLNVMYRPIPDFALCASLAFFSSVCGRAYNFQNDGLNLYMLTMARSAFGKDGLHSVLSILRAKLRTHVPEVDDFFAPAKLTAASALQRHLIEHPSCMIKVGEVGHYFSSLNNKSNDNMNGLRQMYLDIYTKSGRYGHIGAHTYSKEENSLKDVHSPAVTIIGEGTQGSVFENLSMNSIADGFLPRFIIFDVEGERPMPNHVDNDNLPGKLLEDLIALVKHCAGANHDITMRRAPGGEQMVEAKMLKDVTKVGFTTRFAQRMAQLEAEDNGQYNGLQGNEIMSALQGRVLANKKRVAALVAIGRHPWEPQVDTPDFEWAERLINKTYKAIADRITSGEMGNEFSKRQGVVLSVMKNWIDKGPPASYKKHTAEQIATLRAAGCVPMVYISTQCNSRGAFKANGERSADLVRQTVDAMVSDELIERINPKDTKEQFGTSNVYRLTQFGMKQVAGIAAAG